MKCPYCQGTGELPNASLHVGVMILAARQAAGMSQQDVAEKVGLSRPQIANLEAGKTDMPFRRLAKFAEAFGCSMKDLVP